MSTPVGILIDLQNMDDEACAPLSTAEQKDYSSINTAKKDQADEQETYPHLSAEKIADLESIGTTSQQLAKADQAAKKEIDERLKTYSLQEKKQSGGPNLKVAVIGSIGSGKSATANTLLQERKFHESTSAVSQATVTGPFTSKHSPPLTVTDTLGSWMLPKINTGKDDIHLYVLVINLASPRFGREDLKTIQSLQDYNNLMKSKRCIVLLTHASDALQGKSLYEYVQRIKDDPLYDLIMKDMEGWRVMAMNNNCDTKYEEEKQHEMIVKLLQKTYQDADFNKSGFVSNNRFLFSSLAVLSFAVIFLVIFLSAWYTHGAPAATTIEPTTIEANMTTETTAPVMATTTGTTATETGPTGNTSPGTGTKGTPTQETIPTTAGTGDTTAGGTTQTTSGATQKEAVASETGQAPPNRKIQSGG